jgi:hypothetical protein
MCLFATRSVTVSAQQPVVLVDMRVNDIAMSLTVNRRTARANAAVTVRDAGGQVVTGATITGNWSGLVSGAASAVSASNGVATMSSPNSKSSGTFVFTVTGVTLAGFSYQPATNVETSDSITR